MKKKELKKLIACALSIATFTCPLSPVAYAGESEVTTASVEESTERPSTADNTAEQTADEKNNSTEPTAEEGKTEPVQEAVPAETKQQINTTTTNNTAPTSATAQAPNKTCRAGYTMNEAQTFCCPVGSTHDVIYENDRAYNVCRVPAKESKKSDSKKEKDDISSFLPYLLMMNSNSAQSGDDSSTTDSTPKLSDLAGDGNIKQQSAPFKAVMTPSAPSATDTNQVTLTLKTNRASLPDGIRIIARFPDFGKGGYVSRSVEENKPFVIIPAGVSRPTGDYVVYITYKTINESRTYKVVYHIGDSFTSLSSGSSSAELAVSVIEQTEEEKQSLTAKGTISNAEWDSNNGFCRVAVDGDFADNQQAMNGTFPIQTQNISEEDCYASVGKDIAFSKIKISKDENGNDILTDSGAISLDGQEYGIDDSLAYELNNGKSLIYLNIDGATIAYNTETYEIVSPNGSPLTYEQEESFQNVTGLATGWLSVEKGDDGVYHAYLPTDDGKTDFSAQVSSDSFTLEDTEKLKEYSIEANPRKGVLDFAEEMLSNVPVFGTGVSKVNELYKYYVDDSAPRATLADIDTSAFLERPSDERGNDGLVTQAVDAVAGAVKDSVNDIVPTSAVDNLFGEKEDDYTFKRSKLEGETSNKLYETARRVSCIASDIASLNFAPYI